MGEPRNGRRFSRQIVHEHSLSFAATRGRSANRAREHAGEHPHHVNEECVISDTYIIKLAEFSSAINRLTAT